ncbi:unnamed protein product [Prunus armeniaca]
MACLVVQDLETGKILFQGQSDNGLYPFPVPSSSKLSNGVYACLGVKVADDVWHSRLGHPYSKDVFNY